MALDPATRGRLESRPLASVPKDAAAFGPGLHPLGLATERDGLVYVPASAPVDEAAPLIVLLHGAGGEAEGMLALLREAADDSGAILLIPESRRQTWDVITRRYGPDVAFIDLALERLFAHRRIDPARIAIAGFSDGASYALSLGLINGDLFTHILAFAPGFMAPTDRNGRPRIYISHGVEDRVLPIDACSRRIVPQLRRGRYPVHYREFPGGHTVPPDIAREGMAFLLAERHQDTTAQPP